jgi:hypothetical protein
MKQTAVQWLEEQTRKPEWHSLKRGELFDQAKEMEKQQIIDTQSYAISLLKQTTEYEVLDSWKDKVKELEQLINKI